MLIKIGTILFLSGITFSACTSDSSGFGEEHLLNGGQKKSDTTVFDFSTDLTDLADDIAAYKTVVNIIRETGLAQNFVVLPGDVTDVKSYIENNERILEYNPNFMEKLQEDSNWHGISVLARQIGHHLSNHELEVGQAGINEEIEADKYAGFVLFKMGASLDKAIHALEIVMKEDRIGKSVSRNARLVSLTKGWNNAKLLMSDAVIEEIVAVDSVLKDESVDLVALKISNTIEAPAYLYKVFLAIDKTMYFIDYEGVISKEVGRVRHPVGFKKDSDKPGFNWIFVKEGNSYGVDSKGRLWAFSTDGEFHIVGQAVKLVE